MRIQGDDSMTDAEKELKITDIRNRTMYDISSYANLYITKDFSMKARVPESYGFGGTLIAMALAEKMLDAHYTSKQYADVITNAFVPTQFNILKP